ncbi:unnamed protein product, partial [Urochloa humidicola]
NPASGNHAPIGFLSTPSPPPSIHCRCCPSPPLPSVPPPGGADLHANPPVPPNRQHAAKRAMRCAWRWRAAAAPAPGGGDPLGRAAAKASSAFPRWLMLSHHRQEPELVGCRGRPIGPLRRRRLEAKVHLGAQRRRIGAPAAASSWRATACYSTATLTATLPLGPRFGFSGAAVWKKKQGQPDLDGILFGWCAVATSFCSAFPP